MQTEDFDDAFRRKIDLAEHEDVSDKEVETIINYVNQKRSSNNKPHLLYGGLALMLSAVAGLLTWNMIQLQQKRSLEDTINSLQHNSISTIKRDTIYIKEYIPSSGNFKEMKGIREVAHSQNKLIAVLKNESGTNTTLSKTFTTTPVFKLDNPGPNKTWNAKGKTNKDVSPELNIDVNNKEEKNTAVVYIKKKNDFVLLTDDSFALNDANIQLLPEDLIKDQPVEPKSHCRSFTYQLGAGTNIADDQKSLSVLMGINLNTHWNVSTGINFLKIDNYNENDKDEFHYYSNLATVTDTALITFVGVEQTIYQVPVTISYLVPLAKKFSLLFGLGTDLDVYASQNFRYKVTVNTSKEEKSIDKKSPVFVFNNAVLSVGINKEWQHFSLQLSPYINPQIKRVSYKNPESYYGGRIRLFYNF